MKSLIAFAACAAICFAATKFFKGKSGTIIGLFLGIIAALRHNSFLDYGTMVIAVLGISIPNFVIAGLMLYWLGVKWQLLPVAYWDGFAYTIMPTIAIASL